MNVTAFVYCQRLTLPLQNITAYGQSAIGSYRYRTLQLIDITAKGRYCHR